MTKPLVRARLRVWKDPYPHAGPTWRVAWFLNGRLYTKPGKFYFWHNAIEFAQATVTYESARR